MNGFTPIEEEAMIIECLIVVICSYLIALKIDDIIIGSLNIQDSFKRNLLEYSIFGGFFAFILLYPRLVGIDVVYMNMALLFSIFPIGIHEMCCDSNDNTENDKEVIKNGI